MSWIARVKKKLLSRSGSGEYVAALVGFIILVIVIATVLEVYGILMTKRDCEEVAGEITRYIEIKGAFDNLARSEFERICEVDRLDATLSVTKSGRIQLEDEFTVTVETTDYIFTVPVHLNAKATGRSEVYHK